MSNLTPALVEAARQVLRAHGYFVEQLWHVADIHMLCDLHHWPKLSDEEAGKIFALLHARYDGDSGITWPRVEEMVQEFMLNKRGLALQLKPEIA